MWVLFLVQYLVRIQNFGHSFDFKLNFALCFDCLNCRLETAESYQCEHSPQPRDYRTTQLTFYWFNGCARSAHLQSSPIYRNWSWTCIRSTRHIHARITRLWLTCQWSNRRKHKSEDNRIGAALKNLQNHVKLDN